MLLDGLAARGRGGREGRDGRRAALSGRRAGGAALDVKLEVTREAGDEGEYTCRADNSVPPSLSKSVNLQLEGENRSRNI